ncbi:MAG: DUF2267 domain-containing protein [Streptosporangiaceae bacterium]
MGVLGRDPGQVRHDVMIAERARSGQSAGNSAPSPGRCRPSKGAHPVPVEEFVRQVSGRTGVNAEETRTGVGAVLDVLPERLGEDGYRHLVGQLPAAYMELAESAS